MASPPERADVEPALEHYEKLFPRQERLDLGVGALAEANDARAAPATLWPQVEICGVLVDFGGPLEIVQAARAICACPDLEGRRQGLAAVPAHFRNSVRILVEREFHHRSRRS
jgi:hypothetical protein